MSSLIQSAENSATYGRFEVADTHLYDKPADVPPGYIAYNPSALWTVKDGLDIMYVRVEPDHSGPDGSHIGRTVVRPYIVDLRHPEAPLRPYYDGMELRGEDPALTRIKRRLASGAMEDIWLLSCVVPEPMVNKPNEVATLKTRFYAGTDLDNLERVGDGPEWMKDIRIVTLDPSDTKLGVYGRLQPEPASGNISYTTVSDLVHLTPRSILDAPYIDENLFPVGIRKWGGVNDIIRIDPDTNLLIAHRAQYTEESDDHAKRYEAIALKHILFSNIIIDLGVFATAKMFPNGKAKDDSTTDLSDVVFPGGGYNGRLSHVSFGVRDAGIGIGRVVYLPD